VPCRAWKRRSPPRATSPISFCETCARLEALGTHNALLTACGTAEPTCLSVPVSSKSKLYTETRGGTPSPSACWRAEENVDTTKRERGKSPVAGTLGRVLASTAVGQTRVHGGHWQHCYVARPALDLHL
jgi:hypothetical protein